MPWGQYVGTTILRDEGFLKNIRPAYQALGAGKLLSRTGAAAALAGLLAASIAPTGSAAQELLPFKERNIGVTRSGATEQPRSEADQALVDGWGSTGRSGARRPSTIPWRR